MLGTRDRPAGVDDEDTDAAAPESDVDAWLDAILAAMLGRRCRGEVTVELNSCRAERVPTNRGASIEDVVRGTACFFCSKPTKWTTDNDGCRWVAMLRMLRMLRMVVMPRGCWTVRRNCCF
jgi:hypothetical protein